MEKNIVAIIPARGGSKGILRKNIKPFCGKPLIIWSIEAAKESKYISRIIVSTEDKEIAEIAQKAGAEILWRPQELASDTATTVSVLQHAIENIPTDVIVLLQPTSPIRTGGLIDQAVGRFLESGADTLATGYMRHDYEWGMFNNVPRQQLKDWFYDDGNIYIHKPDYVKQGKWFGEKREQMVIDRQYNFEIDDKIDFLVMETIMENILKNNKLIKIGNKLVGDGQPCFIIAEIGINHNGDIEIAKKLIDMAVSTGCDAVKFQKRTIELVYTPEELAKPRENPFGPTNGDLKRGLEFGEEEYREIDRYCKEKGIMWFASPWDVKSVDFLEKFDVPCYKVPSACLTDDRLLKHIKSKGKPIILSTGMSTVEQIKHAVNILGEENLILFHCTSTYPSKDDELNLKVIPWMKENFSCPIGYSGHEVGVYSSFAAVVLGACAVERHITLARAMWGTDQAASLEPRGLELIVREIREMPTIMGDGTKRVYESELPIIQKLRKVK